MIVFHAVIPENTFQIVFKKQTVLVKEVIQEIIRYGRIIQFFLTGKKVDIQFSRYLRDPEYFLVCVGISFQALFHQEIGTADEKFLLQKKIEKWFLWVDLLRKTSKPQSA